jgi:hypothetical protein
LRVIQFSGCEPLSPAARRLFGDARTRLFHSAEWWQHYQQYGVPAGDLFRVFAAESEAAGTPIGLFPAIFSRLYGPHPRARLLYFMGPEGLPYEPILAPDCEDPKDAVGSVIRFTLGARLQYDVLRFSPLEPDSPFISHLVGALRENRYKYQIYGMQEDRYETTAGRSSADYLAKRPAALRETLGTTGRMLFDSGRASFVLVREPADVEHAWRHCESILVQADERNPQHFEYLPGLLRVAADAGVLRLGLLTLDGQPAAMQLWVVARNVAQCLRISQHEQFSDLPLDDMLTEQITPHLIDTDRVVELDFGYIVEQFAAHWAAQRRRRVGIIAFNLRTRRGLKGALRHIFLPKLLALPRRAVRKLRGR